MQVFEGIWLPLITPFRDGEVDLAAAQRLVRHYIDAGIHGFVVCGTTGEPATMDEAEQLALLDAVLDAAEERRPVVMGLGSNDTRAALQALDAIQRRPVAGLLTATPYYTRPSQQGIAAHFRAIASATPLPLILYNVPYRTGVTLDPATAQALAEVPNIVAIKESGGDMNRLMDLIRDTRLQVLSGEDHLSFTTLCLGGSGAIAAAAHLYPEWHVRMYELFRQGELVRARAIAAGLLPLTRALFSEPNPAPIKALLAQQGWIAEELRLPMTAVSAECRAQLIGALAQAGAIMSA